MLARANPSNLRNDLESVYREKLRDALALAEEWARTPQASRPAFSRWVEDNSAVQEALDLEDWLRPENDLPGERQRRAQGVTELLDRAGWPYELIELFRRRILKRQRGRPLSPATRRLAILALESKRTDERFSWMRFAASNCDCAKRQHDASCKERIRQAAIALQRLLDRVGVAY